MVMAGLMGLCSIIVVCALLYQNGRFVENNRIYIIVVGYAVLLAGMLMTSPSIAIRNSSYILFILAVVSFLLKEKYFRQSRWLLNALILTESLLMLFYR